MTPDLRHYIDSRREAVFAYGELDCALFVAGWVKIATGCDLTHGLAGHYRTEQGGIRQLRRLGFADHVACAAAALPEIPVAQARAGDIAALPVGPGARLLALGIVTGPYVRLVSERGLTLRPLTDAVRAFAVRAALPDGRD